MQNIIIEEIYTRPDKKIPEYADAFFKTNVGIFEVGAGHIEKCIDCDLSDCTKANFINELKLKYGPLVIKEARITYDSDKYFLISDKFLLVLGYQPNTYSILSTNCFWIIEDIDGVNKNDFADFLELDMLNFME